MNNITNIAFCNELEKLAVNYIRLVKRFDKPMYLLAGGILGDAGYHLYNYIKKKTGDIKLESPQEIKQDLLQKAILNIKKRIGY